MFLRIIKTFLVFSFGLYFLLVAYGNVIDFETNFVFMRHVLSMNTTFQSPSLMHRAITDFTVQKFFYEIMIGMEALIALSLLLSALFLARSLGNRITFDCFVPMALGSLCCSFLYFFVGFLVIGGEWFCMWQSHVANAQPIAGTFSLLSLLAMIFLKDTSET